MTLYTLLSAYIQPLEVSEWIPQVKRILGLVIWIYLAYRIFLKK